MTERLPEGYRAAVEHLPDLALLYNASGELVHVNPAGHEQLAYAGSTAAEATGGVALQARVAPEDRPRLQEALTAATLGTALPALRLRLTTADGRTLTVACVVHPLQLAGQRFVQVLAHDVTGRAAAAQTVADSEALFRALFDHSPVGIAVVERRHFVHVNDALCRLLGRSRSELLRLSPDDVTHPDDLEINDRMHQARETGAVAEHEKRYVRPDGTVLWAETTVVGVQVAGQGRSLVHVRDITQQRDAAAQLREQALHDPLTGLGNRALLDERLGHVLARRPGDRPGLAVLFVDLDNFKRINDALGHQVGDRVLALTAERLREAVRPADTLIRWGGDEFVVVLEDVAEPQVVLTVVDRIRQALARPIPHRYDELLVTASIGVALAAPGETVAPARLLQEADAAAYRAKQSGRDRHRVFDEALRLASTRRSDVEDLLRRGADGRGLVLHYQPIVTLADRRVVGAEALLRLQDGHTLLYPADFLDLAQETGLMLPIEHHVLAMACRQAAVWRRQGRRLSMNVNVCARQVGETENFEAAVRRAVDAAGLEPGALVCELTEHGLLDPTSQTLDGLRRMQISGVQFSLDDFGTGYASMAYLQTLPLQEVKVDRRFVARAGEDRRGAAIVRAVAGLTRELGMRCLAEGIEDEAGHRLAGELGATYGQGYLYGRPVPAADFPVA